MALESEVEVLKSVVNKLDTSIEKISQVSTDIGKLLAVHEQRIDTLEKVDERRVDDIKEIHSRITTGNRELMDKMDQLEVKIEERMRKAAESATTQHKEIQNDISTEIKGLERRIDTLEKWKWIMLGGAATVGYLISHLSVFSKLFSL